MDSKRIFNEIVPELENLPEKPSIFWYVSAGKDFRGLSFLSSYNREHQMTNHKRDLKRPDLFVFNCLGPDTDELIQTLKTNDNSVLFKDDRTKIVASNFRELTIKKEVQDSLVINSEYMDFPEEYQKRKISPAYFFNITVSGEGYSEVQKVLYFEHENINFFHEIILNDFFNVEYLCATREGLGFGGCKKSIVEYIYKDKFPISYTNQGFKPTYLVLFNDFTRTLFRDTLKNSNLISFEEDYGNYPSEDENGWRKDSTVYRLSYRD